MRRRPEMASLLELAATLGSGPAGADALDAALRIVTRELQVERGALFVRNPDGDAWALRASRGLPRDAPSTLGSGPPRDDFANLGPGDEAHDRHGFVLLEPIRRRGRPVAVLGLGPREGGRPFGPDEHAFLRGVAACTAASIENDLLQDELRRVHRRLSVKAFELLSLLDVSRDLAGDSAEEAIQSLVVTGVMGHFVVSRCALYLFGPRGLALAHGRGLPRDAGPPIPQDAARSALEGLTVPVPVAALAEGPLKRRLDEARLVLAVPLVAGGPMEGVLAVGERASGTPFSAEDHEIALTLARQALGALEAARLRRVREMKERQDRELQIAREIQTSLLPRQRPEVPGFEVAATSRPCYEVGGDYYDWIPLGGERLALVVADVSGKGTPASLLVASVHASVQALAGAATPAPLVERLNRFLFANTQASRFVTLFYAELDAASRRLTYVNAGHVPPFRVARDGTASRLTEGGPALGLLAEASFEVGEVRLEPGDVLAMVTDGVTEATSPHEVELGDARVCDLLRRLSGAGAPAVLEGIVAEVDGWVGDVGCSDDLTALVLVAR